ncbi:folate/biopterin family MFS transporter [Thiohalocapsa marina]|uniref:Folate/biopterin family MFS transporter n=2 Tax=Thiohalocapsa marina TaxID=424902 RepID=A0A5M8FTF8_9GAMM|nr:folate/biopterin family MFS transporter [Thiohalocapsa marina]
MRLSYLPPLMVYIAYGIQGLTAIVGTFFVKDYLGLSAAFLASLGFWAGIPWALKMPLGHLVDLIWRHKAGLVYLGAGMLSASMLIMLGLLAERAAMDAVMPVAAWYVLAALLAPVGYVLQDVVADAMTVEAVPRVDADGRPLDPVQRRLMHTTMQTLGRVAIIGGGVLVALANVFLFAGVETMSEQDKIDTYILIYQLALVIPLISILGVALAGHVRRRDLRRLVAGGLPADEARRRLTPPTERTTPNWWILGGSLVFVVFTLTLGLTDVPYNQEIIFAGSMAIVLFLMSRLLRVLESQARLLLLGTALIIFVFRAMPGPGPGQTWWMIDELAFDQQFLSVLALIGSSLTLLGLFLFRRFMAERSIAYVVVFLTLISSLLYLPIIGMYFGLHQWTANVTGGIVDARFIALVDTALESPLGQIAMVPMLAWIANSAPDNLKATFFAVMASFTNLALSAGQLGTKYLNQLFLVTREVRDPVTGAVSVAADYSELGMLMLTALLIGLILPLAAVGLIKLTRLRSA